MSPKSISVAIAGNPNSGKTTIFNNITGYRQHVANYPGVTVEKKEGRCVHKGRQISIVDLPGTYCLTAYSMEELVARNFVIEEKPDVVVDVVDASNLERNLYLTTQLIELDAPIVIALNMSDLAERQGISFDLDHLSTLLGAPVIRMVGNKKIGTPELLDAVIRAAESSKGPRQAVVHYGREIDEEVEKLAALLEQEPDLAPHYPVRWLAVKLLEDDKVVLEVVQNRAVTAKAILAQLAASAKHLTTIFGDSPETVIADRRYGFISGACQESVASTTESRHSTSDRIDAIVMSPLVGIPLLLVLMYLVFYMTFTAGKAPMDWIESLFTWLGGTVNAFWPKGTDSALRSLLVDGIIGGVGGVIVFLPNIMLLFLGIALLEDTGYMARAAFVMDNLMHKIGLHGKSFIPMLIGFGCSVPAIMATRTLESRRDRLTTMLIVPLMSCGARLTIYALIIPAFFPSVWAGPIMWIIYVIGIIAAIIAARLLRGTILRGDPTPFVMELPPYRLPTFRGLVIHMWERGWLYLRKAGTLILAFSVILWAMTAYPKKTIFEKDYDGIIRQAESEYLRESAALANVMELSPEAAHLFEKAIVTEREAERTSSKYYESDPRYAEVLRERDATLAGIFAQEGGARIHHFFEMRVAIKEARAAFADGVTAGGYEPNSAQYAILQHRLDTALGETKSIDPRAYAAALGYLDGTRARFETTLRQALRERQAEEVTYSVTGRLGRVIAPVIKPLGFDWRIGTALTGALVAKEVFVAQLGIVFAVSEEGEAESRTALRDKLQAAYTPLKAFCVMLFCLLSCPCVATIAVTMRESNSWKWAAFQAIGLTVLAWIVTFVVYQAGTLLRIGVA